MKLLLYCLAGLALTFPRALGENFSGAKIARAARSQIGKTVRYDPRYQTLAYPNGDVDIAGGVCTDVIIRALRTGLGLDLQRAVHEDMVANFSKYPQTWGLHRPDKNIDHRRVPNLQVYFKRQGYELAASKNFGDYKPGDLVTCLVPPHSLTSWS